MKLRFSIDAHIQDTHTYIQILILQFSFHSDSRQKSGGCSLTSWYSSFLFLTLGASSDSLDTDVPGMSSNQMVSVSVKVRLTTFPRSSSVSVSFTSSRLCRISTEKKCDEEILLHVWVCTLYGLIR